MEKKTLLNFMLVFLFAISVAGQNKTVKGRIIDAATNAPLTGASIITPGTTQGTVSDNEGYFQLNASSEIKVIQVSLVGYISQTISITNGDNLIVSLVSTSKGLEDIVVVGYGTQKKKDLTGSVSTVAGKDISGRRTIQVSEALQGTVAGVTVTRSSGAPGAGATIRIRGITTNGVNDPLYLVDGVPVSSIDNVNPNDIESISVLKDAASAAIYGSRAAAGVILVSTRRAKNGQSEMEYNYEYGAQQPTALPQFVGVQDYMRYFNEQAINDGASSGTYPDAYINSYLDSNRANPDKFPNTNWQNTTMKYKLALRQRHDLSFTVGTGKLKAKASFGYQNAKAFYDNYDYERYQFRLNNDLQVSERLQLNLDIAYKRTNNKNVINTPGFGSPIYEGRVLPPIYDDYYDDGRYAPGKDGRNPIAQIYEGGFSKSFLNQIMARAAVVYKPFKDLTLTGLFSPSYDFDRGKSYSKQIKFTDKADPSRVIFTNLRTNTFLSESRNETTRMNGQLLANYKKQFLKNHTIDVLAGYEENYYNFESLGASRDGFALNGYPYLSVGSQLFRDNSGSATESALRSFFGRVNYNINEKYYLQANLRNDKSSRFGKDYRNALFPSVSLGWVLSKEGFLQNVNWLSFLKLRSSLGETGNERIGDYPYQANLDASTALFYQGTTVVPLTGYAQTTFAIGSLTWEKTRTLDFGADLAFLNNRLTATADYFERKTTDILLLKDIPNYVGYNDPYDNLGTIGSKGWEVELGWKDKVGKFNYSIATNLSDAKTKVIEISNTGALGSIVNIKGQEFNSWYGYRTAGIFQTAAEVAASPVFANTKPGDIKYIDLGKNGTISSDNDREILGGSLPRYIYGGNIRFDYEGWDVAIVFQGVGKKLSLLPGESIQPFAEAFGNVPAAMAGKFWSTKNTAEQNLAAFYPRLSRSSNGNNYLTSDHYLISGAYFRLKNITLGYTFPATVLNRLHIKSLRLYMAANDIFSIDKFPDYMGSDPEAASYGYPIVRTFLAGITVRF